MLRRRVVASFFRLRSCRARLLRLMKDVTEDWTDLETFRSALFVRACLIFLTVFCV